MKSQKAIKKQLLRDRVAALYRRGRANLQKQELQLFKLPVDQRQKKGIEAMTIWITLVETIFRRRGQARQELMDTWLTETTPVRSWREKLKDANLENSQQGGEEGIS